MTNIIRAVFNCNEYNTTAARPDGKPIYQYNYGQILQINGLDLQKAVEIHFSHSMITGDAIIRIGTTTDKITEVAVPEKFLETNGTVTAYIYVSNMESGQTEYKIQFQIAARAKPEAWDSPEDAELFHATIEAVNESAGKAEDAAVRAEASAGNAEQSAQDAEVSATAAKTSETTAKNLADGFSETVGNAKVDITTHTTQEKEQAISAIKAQGGEVQENISESVNTANTAKTDLETAINNASTTKSQLEQVITNVDAAGESQVQAVNNAGVAQVQAVQQEGADQIQIMQSHLVDYAKVEEVSELRSDLDNKTQQINSDICSLQDKSNEFISKFGIRKKYHKLFKKFDLPIELSDIASMINVYTDGCVYFHDFHIEQYKNLGGKIHYVSPNGTGPSANSTKENPTQFRNLLNNGYLNNGDTIYFADGVYNDFQKAIVKDITTNINMIAENSGAVYIANCGNELAYTSSENGIYTTTRSNVLKIIQIINGDIVPLTKADNVEGCNFAGTWYLDSDNVLTIHLFNDEIPTYENCIVCLNYNIPVLNVSPIDDCNLYIDGINFVGGRSATALIAGANDKTVNLFAKNCGFFGAYDTTLARDAVSMRGANGYFVGCRAEFSSKDGFNYHALNGNTPQFIEIDCVGANNGIDGVAETQETAQYWQNGSSAHDGCKGLRIGGFYYNNYGANVADVHNDTITVNIGCTAFDSSAPKDKPDACADFCAQQSGTTMYLIGCRAFGSVSSARAVTGAEINVKSCDLENGTSGTDTIS